MKQLIILLLMAILLFTVCNSPQEMVKKAVDTVETKVVEKTNETKEKEPIIVSKEEAETFFKSAKTMSEKYEDIDFMSPVVAAIQAGKSGLDIDRIFEKELNMTFKEYGTLSTRIVMAEAEYQGVVMTKDIYNQMENGYEKALEEKDKVEMTKEEKEKYQEQLDEILRQLTELEEKLESTDVERIKENHKIINEVKEKYGY